MDRPSLLPHIRLVSAATRNFTKVCVQNVHQSEINLQLGRNCISDFSVFHADFTKDSALLGYMLANDTVGA